MVDPNACKDKWGRNIYTLEQRVARLEELYEVMSEWHKPELKHTCYLGSGSEKCDACNPSKPDTITIDRKIAERYLAWCNNCVSFTVDVVKPANAMRFEIRRALEAEDGK